MGTGYQEMVDSRECVVVGVDDTIQNKTHSQENELVCWHYDHTEGRTIKGINLLSAVLTTEELVVPIGAEFIRKPIQQQDSDGRTRRTSEVTKNELFRWLLTQCWQNTHFDYVAADSWFAGTENMDFIKNTLTREFVMAVKTNRLAATSKADQKAGRWTRIEALAGQGHPLRVWLRGMEFSVLLLKQVFKNEDRSEGVRYLVASDLTLSTADMIGIYLWRWRTEEYHTSINLGRGNPSGLAEYEQVIHNTR